MIHPIDRIFTALQTIGAVTMQLETMTAPLQSLTPEANTQIRQGIEVIERQLALIRTQMNAEEAEPDTGDR